MPPGYVLQWLPLELMGVVAAVAAGAWLWRSVIGPGLKRARAVARRIEDFLEGWEGRPKRPGFPAEPGMPERVRTIEDLVPGWTTALTEHTAAIEEIRYHIQPNHGGSAHDALVRKIDALDSRLDRLTDAQLAVGGTIDRIEQDKRAAHEEILQRLRRVEHPHTDGEES